ncbi:MAG: hypothetical protein DRR06_07735 [Gammaproteobacteria bacterium]|nr:MAG: hypothetical protein DRR06_07735 [Gammaproteobacteria bacterium]RLA51928.1 MAG: hypothetical protein DRR42_08970 [Gammaproteobacteria bacterium]
MNWDAIGAVGEILGAGAVVISLIYLAAQIRIQNKESRMAAMHEISLGFRESLDKFGEREIADIFVRANKDFDSLTEVETLRLITSAAAFFRSWEEAYIQNEGGRLDSRIWNTINRYYTTIFSAPAFQQVWILRKEQFDDKFRDFVDNVDLKVYNLK